MYLTYNFINSILKFNMKIFFFKIHWNFMFFHEVSIIRPSDLGLPHSKLLVLIGVLMVCSTGIINPNGRVSARYHQMVLTVRAGLELRIRCLFWTSIPGQCKLANACSDAIWGIVTAKRSAYFARIGSVQSEDMHWIWYATCEHSYDFLECWKRFHISSSDLSYAISIVFYILWGVSLFAPIQYVGKETTR